MDGDTIYYEITLVRKPISCPFCGNPMIGHGHKLKTIHHPAVRDRNGIILYNANRYICKSCKHTTFEKNPFAFSGFNSSFLLLQTAMRKLANLNYTFQMISDELNISTTQLCKYLDSYVTIPPRALPESLGIDEIHNKALSKKNSRYLCVLVDNTARVIYEVLDSRSKEALCLYFSSFPRYERLKVKYVTIDMWEPYKDVASIYLPEAAIAVDPFHVISHLTKGFDKLRINLMNQCEYGSNAYYLLKKWHWLLQKDDVFLDNDKVFNRRFQTKLNRRDLFDMIVGTFPILAEAYDLKEEYRLLNKTATYAEACEKLPIIRKKFKNSGIGEYEEFTKILFKWETEILNSFLKPYDDRKLSNSLAENINGKIQGYITVANGVSNFPRFRKRVIYALSPKIYYSLTTSLYSDKRRGKLRGKYKKQYI